MEHPASPPTGTLIKIYRYSQVFIYFLMASGVATLLLAAFLFSVRSKASADGQSAILWAVALLVAIGCGFFAVVPWQRRLRAARHEVYERGLVQVIGSQRSYVAFAEMEDVYLFSSGQTVLTGLMSNLAYRRDSTDPFRWSNDSLKRFYEFQQLVRELHVRERLPVMIAALQAGETVTFNYVPTGEVWKKRVSGRFLEVSTRPITLSRDCLQVEGRTVPTSTLRDVDVGTWTQNVTLNDATGSTVFSTMGVGILSFDLFLETVSWLVQDAQR
ncbi:hypothetical protein A7X89_12610 [Stenotrophomonas maltophilia]|uniref:DUF6585 family protein n=1 Tax=Stenotrophomonas TaxID=40323 RepID=UPI000DA77231|nr:MULTISPECIES: DUF6585 family protein [Stenotrophomonas]MBA0327179.1 hypothetical protein [Stenotrophomonas maltophilia]MBH1445065.1 hypothetical protein [Stenotrophomonas maltophilia]MBN7849815.1 hypothetical protein [Stenotrophomonas maltophilia]MBO0394199.1 hypothetical protein [Stenotrophomonas maltophilia]MCR1006236.1 hypothetical protein [Stenotrophomonas maltophilia]